VTATTQPAQFVRHAAIGSPCITSANAVVTSTRAHVTHARDEVLAEDLRRVTGPGGRGRDSIFALNHAIGSSQGQPQVPAVQDQVARAMVNRGDRLGALERMRDELGLGESVRFAGFLKGADLCALYHEAHVFLHPSRITADQNQEGVPNAMLEAMATGLPVVATLHGGIPEAVRDGVTGVLGAERDREGLAAALLGMEEEGRWRAMGAAAAADMAANFEATAQVAKLEACYDEALTMR
jgi:glycosyltransferase involved in cell wall biosynthesis